MSDIIKKIDTLFELDRYDDVIQLAIKYLQNPEVDSLDLYRNILPSFINLKEYNKAAQYCKEAIALYPYISAFYYYNALIYYRAYNVIEEAMQNIDQALSISQSDSDYFTLKSLLLYEKFQIIEAKEMIEKALEIDPNSIESQLTYALYLTQSGEEHVTKEILEDILSKDPHNQQALYIKNGLFVSNLKEKKVNLKALLSREPFDETYQRDLKFIDLYYKYIPLFMLIQIGLLFLLNLERYHYGFLENILPFTFLILASIGSKDYRFNIPFIALSIGINTYYTNIPDGLKIGDYFAIAFFTTFFHFASVGLFMIVNSYSLNVKNKIKELAFKKENVFFYYLFVYPFSKQNVVDTKKLKQYYQYIMPFMLGTLFSFIYYQNELKYLYEGLHYYFAILFFITAVISSKNFFFSIIYITLSWYISKGYEFDAIMIIGSMLFYPLFLGLNNLIFYRSKQ